MSDTLTVIGKRIGTDTNWKQNSTEFIADGIDTIEINGIRITVDRLRELAEAERAGRVVVLPCKVMDIVFALAHCGDVRYFCDNDYETGTGATTCPFEKQCGIEECDNDDLHVFAVEVASFFFGDKNPADGAVVVNELEIDLSLSDFGKRVFVTEAEAERALSSANEPADRCSTCENNGKSICSSCIMTGHGNDIDFYRAATEPKGEHHD